MESAFQKKFFTTKRSVAKKLRQAAAAIDKYGFIQGAYGHAGRGFCSLGAMQFVSSDVAPQLVFGAFLRQEFGKRNAPAVSVWNDAKVRTKEDVTGTMRRCARFLEHGGNL